MRQVPMGLESMQRNRFSLMIQYLKFRFKLGKLFREKEKTEQRYMLDQEKLSKNRASLDEKESLYSEERSQVEIHEYEIEVLTTNYFMKLAKSRFIETPDWNDGKAWVESSLDPNRKVLSHSAISELRSKITQYRKERNEQMVPVITAVTGLMGALMGVIALFMSAGN